MTSARTMLWAMEPGDRVSRKSKVGSVIHIFRVDPADNIVTLLPDGTPPLELAVVAWPGKQGFDVVPVRDLTRVPS